MSYFRSSNVPQMKSQDPFLLQLPNDNLDDLFSVDEEGNLQVLLHMRGAPIRLTRRPLRNFTRRAPISSFSTSAAKRRATSAVGIYGSMDLSLADLCDYVDDQPSLQAAEIISTECYAVKAGAVMHRFIVLELRRHDRKDVWLRLDRRRGENASILQFFAASGITAANDRAMLSAHKDLLVTGDALCENRQVFEVPPVLKEFTRLLRIIKEELVTYRIWPENCWFFCSLVQEHLGAQTGSFTLGSLKHTNLAKDVRARIYSRVLTGRPPHRSQASNTLTYNPPARAISPAPRLPSHVSSSFLIPSTFPQTASSPSLGVSAALRLENPSAKVIDALGHITRNQSIQRNVRNQAVEALNLSTYIDKVDGNKTSDRKNIYEPLASLLHEIGLHLPGFKSLRVILHSEAVRLQRGVFINTPLGEQATLAGMLHIVGFVLGDDGRPDEACRADEEALLIRKQIYKIQPSASRLGLALSWFNYGLHLSACKRYEEACDADTEAVRLYKTLFERDPDGYRKRFASSLTSYGSHLGRVRRFEDARRNHEEAISLYRQLFKRHPEEHREDLARCLESYSYALDDLGMVSESRLAREESNALRASGKIKP